MALGDRRGGGSNLTYLSVYSGKIVREWRKEKPSEKYVPEGKDLMERVNSNDVTIYFVEYDYMGGIIKDVELDQEGNYGDQIRITFQDVDEMYLLSIQVESSYGRTFLWKLQNIDVTEEIYVIPYSFTSEDGKARSGLTLRKGDPDGEKIPNYYSKENPNGLPELEIKKKGKKTTYNSDDRDAFLYDRLEEFIQKVKGSTAKPVDSEVTSAFTEKDDLPF